MATSVETGSERNYANHRASFRPLICWIHVMKMMNCRYHDNQMNQMNQGS